MARLRNQRRAVLDALFGIGMRHVGANVAEPLQELFICALLAVPVEKIAEIPYWPQDRICTRVLLFITRALLSVFVSRRSACEEESQNEPL